MFGRPVTGAAEGHCRPNDTGRTMPGAAKIHHANTFNSAGTIDDMTEDTKRHRAIQELGDSIQLERDEMAKLRPNDPRWSGCFARLNELLGQRNRLKNS